MMDAYTMKKLTIDVGVLIDGSGIGSVPEYGKPSNDLMKRVSDQQLCHIAVDHKGKIMYQYKSKLKEGTFGHHWICELASRDMIRPVRSLHFTRGVVTKLKEAHFDPEDYKYVVTAGATISKVLVSHDPDYSPKVCSILKKELDVRVLGSKECLAGELKVSRGRTRDS
ncbi:hypothetical protein ACFL5F_09380 [Planctomycetota bacterium]